MSKYESSSTVELRSTSAAVAIAAITMGLAAAYGSPDAGYTQIQSTGTSSAPETDGEQRDTLVRCVTERECYERIAACIADGGEWLGNEKSGRCRRRGRAGGGHAP